MSCIRGSAVKNTLIRQVIRPIIKSDLVVTEAPVFSGVFDPPDGLNGVYYNYSTRLLFTGGKPSTYTIIGTLPNGLSINPNSGIISGTPTSDGVFGGIQVVASNEIGSSDPSNVANIEITTALINVLSLEALQQEVPNGNRVLRSQLIKVVFNQPVNVVDASGVIASVNNSSQIISVDGSGTDTLYYKLQRAIFKHSITWAYSKSTGNITSAVSGVELDDVSESAVLNNLPAFTVWDYSSGETGGFNDTSWDTDESRFDEET